MAEEKVIETIEQLLIVQERDCRIARCLKELKSIPVRTAELESSGKERNKALEHAKDFLKKTQAQVHKVEVEIEAERQRILKLRDQQVQVKSNEEYRAMNNEIAGIEKNISSLEDQVIELMEQVDRAESKADECRTSLKEGQARAEQKIRELEKRREALEKETEELKSERESLASGIDKEWLTRYNMLMDNKGDVALAVMEKGGICGACHMNLPPQVMHDVRGMSSMVSCSFCGRLLYWAEYRK